MDGAHSPGQIPLNVEEAGADFYIGNCHKWLNSPKGAGFLYSRPEVQHLLRPLVVSWGWPPEDGSPSPFVSVFEWTGTDDPSAYLSVPAAIEFQEQHEWDRVRAACHLLAEEARGHLIQELGLGPICPDEPGWWSQMFALSLPEGLGKELQDRLAADFAIEVPVMSWNDRPLLRVSVQAYNRPDDVERLVSALGKAMSVRA